jgi:hypothetical protein
MSKGRIELSKEAFLLLVLLLFILLVIFLVWTLGL